MADGKVTIQTLLDETGVKSGLGKLNNTISSGIKVGVKAVATGTAAVTAGVVSISKSAVSAFASYEQLVGGVDTLFKKSSKQVQHYADIAYKTAQMSANDYMETVTSFSASLIQGLGGDTKKAAKLADKAIIDMSDNANKMGTDIELIKNAYQGFAKGNFTMLDNLKLGYGGTKTEMARLINDTKVLEDTIVTVGKGGNFDKVVTFDKMIEAIHKVQGELGITGTSAKEAATTIEGSASAMKASWENLLTGIGRGEDFDRLFNEFLNSFQTYMDNLEPVIENVIDGIGKLAIAGLKKLYPVIEQLLSNVPDMLSTIIGIVEEVMPKLFNVVIKAIPKLWSYVTSMVLKYVEKLFGSQISSALENLLSKLSNEFVRTLNAVWQLIQKVLVAIRPLVTILINLASYILPLFANAINFIVDNFDFLYPILMAVVSGFIAFKVVSIIGGLLSALPAIISGVSTAMTTLNAIVAANPIVALATAVGLLTASLVLLFNSASGGSETMSIALTNISDKTSILNDKINEQKEATKNLTDSYTSLSEQSASRVAAIEVETSQSQSYWQELKRITDENGNIKKGYEDRAQYITGELSNALGVEFEWSGKQITNMKELNKQMAKSIAQQKLKSTIDAKTQEYNEAKAKEVELAAQLSEQETVATQARTNFEKASREAEKAAKDLRIAKQNDSDDVDKLREKWEQSTSVLGGARDALISANNNLESTKSTYNDMVATIDNYEDALNSVGKSTKTMNKASENLATNFKKNGKASTDALEKQAKDSVENYAKIKKAVKSGSKSITDSQLKQAKRTAEKNLTEWEKSGENIIKGYIAGLTAQEKEDGLADAIQEIVGNAVKKGNEAAKIKSPSRKTLWSGRMLAQGWVKGFTKEDPAGQIVKTVKYGTSSIQEAMNRDLKLNMNSTIESNMGNIGDAMVSSLEKAGLSIDVEGRQFGRLVRRYG